MFSAVVSSQTTRLTTTRAVAATSIASRARWNSTSTMHDNDPEVLEREKKRNLSGKTPNTHDGAPGWNEVLASASEASVKADKSDRPLSDLQQSTVEFIRRKTSIEAEEMDGVKTSTAYSSFRKDEVTGPLSGAKGKEEVITNVRSRHAETREPDDVVVEYLKREGSTPSEEDVDAGRGELDPKPRV